MESALAKSTRSSRPTVIFAYTLKGWKLPSVGHPQNHSFLLTDEQMESLRVDLANPCRRRRGRALPTTARKEGCVTKCPSGCGRKAQKLPHHCNVQIPEHDLVDYRGLRSTQQTFGTILNTLSREYPELAQRIVTVSPDVASSTNLGGWINKHEVWQLGEQEELPEDQIAGILHWTGIATRSAHRIGHFREQSFPDARTARIVL